MTKGALGQIPRPGGLIWMGKVKGTACPIRITTTGGPLANPSGCRSDCVCTVQPPRVNVISTFLKEKVRFQRHSPEQIKVKKQTNKKYVEYADTKTSLTGQYWQTNISVGAET